MTVRALTRWRTLLFPIIAVASLASSACYKGGLGGSGPTVLLIVENQGFYDVNVFAVRATAGSGRRLGTVSGNSRATLRVPESDVQAGGTLVVNVRSVGGRVSWTSPPVQVGPGVVARLDVIQNANGDLGRSQLYSQVVPRDIPADTGR